MFLSKSHRMSGKVQKKQNMHYKRTTTKKCVDKVFTFHPVLSQRRMHLWDLQTLQKQSLVDSWQPKHFLKDHSTQKHFPTLSCFHCFLDSQHKPCSQGGIGHFGLKERDTNMEGYVECCLRIKKTYSATYKMNVHKLWVSLHILDNEIPNYNNLNDQHLPYLFFCVHGSYELRLVLPNLVCLFN